jgi:hypothetical protein
VAHSPALHSEPLKGKGRERPRVRSGRTEADNLQRAIELVAGFIASL